MPGSQRVGGRGGGALGTAGIDWCIILKNKKLNAVFSLSSLPKYKTYSPKIMRVQELLFASASCNFVRLFAGRLRLNPARRKNFFCSYKFNHKNFFAVGFSNRSATTSFSAVRLPKTSENLLWQQNSCAAFCICQRITNLYFRHIVLNIQNSETVSFLLIYNDRNV